MIYQPIPLKAERQDCEERYQVIQKTTNFYNRSLIDIACANGYFGFRFLQDGGAKVVGVESDINYINLTNILARIEKVNFKCVPYPPEEQFDIGIYLDTHSAEFTKHYPRWLSKHVKLCYTSTCKDSAEYRDILKTYFKKVRSIYQGYQDRIIYQCE